MTDPTLYYVVRKVETEPSKRYFVKSTYQISKFSGHKQPDSTGIVRHFHNNNYDSDDKGFQYHKNQDVNKRIQVVRKHQSLGEPGLTAYWHDDKNKVMHHTSEVHPLLK